FRREMRGVEGAYTLGRAVCGRIVYEAGVYLVVINRIPRKVVDVGKAACGDVADFGFEPVDSSFYVGRVAADGLRIWIINILGINASRERHSRRPAVCADAQDYGYAKE
ncbi:MAG TPA: hypothetical protein PLI69_07415, partial [Bacteroidales bacterium]|nr:hypothetical protein [Bacteroidales bacterium]